MYKTDLHTHSIASPDGSLKLEDYRRMLASGGLDFIAITDHNRIDFALAAQSELGDAVIVGEEITTIEGELIGLFLQSPVPAGKSLQETAAFIHAQSGLVYVPHPFETVRKGVTSTALDRIADMVDIVEIFNGRALFQNRGSQAEAWARNHKCPGAASSDAHGPHGWGKTYSAIDRVPQAATLRQIMHAAQYRKRFVGLIGALYPKLNRLRKVHPHA